MEPDELTENILEDARKVRIVLNMTLEEYERYRGNTIQGLLQFGGEFARALGNALKFADLDNSVKILYNWQKECIEHELLWRISEATKRSCQ